MDGEVQGDVLGDNMVLGVMRLTLGTVFPQFSGVDSGIPGSGNDTSLNLLVLQRRPVTDMDERR